MCTTQAAGRKKAMRLEKVPGIANSKRASRRVMYDAMTTRTSRHANVTSLRTRVAALGSRALIDLDPPWGCTYPVLPRVLPTRGDYRPLGLALAGTSW